MQHPKSEVCACRCLKVEPSAVDYICWLSVEVTGLLEVFAGVNENFISATVEGTFVMAGDSVDLTTFQTVAADSRADILPTEQDVRTVVCVVLKKWWCCFGYSYVLAAIQDKLREVIALMQFVLL
jgi:hypothetical protein